MKEKIEILESDLRGKMENRNVGNMVLRVIKREVRKDLGKVFGKIIEEREVKGGNNESNVERKKLVGILRKWK